MTYEEFTERVEEMDLVVEDMDMNSPESRFKFVFVKDKRNNTLCEISKDSSFGLQFYAYHMGELFGKPEDREFAQYLMALCLELSSTPIHER